MKPTDSGESKRTADQWISVELRTARSIGAKLVAMMKAAFNLVSADTSPVAPRTQLVLVDRKTAQPISVQDWGGDIQGAQFAKQTFEEDLRALDVESFCLKYYLDWIPWNGGNESTG
jgi:hypothetical protein